MKSAYYIVKSIILFSLLFFLFAIVFFHFSKVDTSFEDIVKDRREINGYIADVIIDNVKGVYNTLDDSYYFSINENKNTYLRNIKINSGYDFFVLEDDIYNYYDGRIVIYNDSYYNIVNIKFIFIPILSITDDSIFIPNFSCFNSFYNRNEFNNIFFPNSECDISQSDLKNMVLSISTGSSYDFSRSFSYNVSGNYHVRGASSLIFDKKSYKLNFDSNESPLGLLSGKDFVLDSLYNDSSKIRNKLSSDLWNVINDNQIFDNDLDSVFVELFINNEYKGLYCMKNSVTSNMLSLSNSGLLLKPYTDFNSLFLEKLINNDFIVDNNMFLNFEIKFSKNTDLSIEVFRNKVFDVYENNSSYSSIKNNFDIDNYVNYQVFLSIIMGVDNVSKNYYLSLSDYSDKLFITPWDMDLTFGNNWDSTVFNGESFEFDSCYNLQWIRDNIIDRNPEQINKMIVNRYMYLRKTILTEEQISSLFVKYKHDIIDSSATDRDSVRWYTYDPNYSISIVQTWLIERLKVLDQFFSEI